METSEPRVTRIKRTRKNGDIYVIDETYVYDKEKKMNRTISSKLIGKIPKGSDVMVPTRPKRPSGSKKTETEHAVTAACKRVGMMDIVDYIGTSSGIDDAVYDSMDRGTAQKVLSIARFWFATYGESLTKIENWQYMHTLPYTEGVSEGIYHDLFNYIGRSEDIRQRFFYSWCEQFDNKDAIAFDTTTVSTSSHQIVDAQYGFNKDDNGKKTVKILSLYSLNKHLPMLYEKQPGYIADVSCVANCIKHTDILGIKSRDFVTDNGFYSLQNLSDMLDAGFNFITLVETNILWIKPVIEELKSELTQITSLCPWDNKIHGVTKAVKQTFTKTRKYDNHNTGAEKGDEVKFTRRVYVHVYFSREQQNKKIEELDKDILSVKTLIESGTPVADLKPDAQDIVKKYFTIRTWGTKKTVTIDTEKVNKAYGELGYFVLVSNSNKDTFDCLNKYRKREWIEMFYRSWGQSTDGNTTRVWDAETLQGKFFAQFIALCYYEVYANKIREMKEIVKNELNLPKKEMKYDEKTLKSLSGWLNNKTFNQTLQWFDMIEEKVVSVQLRNKRWKTEYTNRDKLFLNLMGVPGY